MGIKKGQKAPENWFNKEWRRKLSEGQKRAYKEGRRKVHKNTIENFKNLNKGKFGKEHPKWTENKKRSFYQTIRQLHEYRLWRTNIFERDNFTCQKCGQKGGYLEADHYPRRFIDILRENNVQTIDDVLHCTELLKAQGRTLCKKCHLTTYARLSKR